MSNNSAVLTDVITIRFAMICGQGLWPMVEDLSKAEIDNVTRFCKFNLNYDPEFININHEPGSIGVDFNDVEIMSCEILYDGVSYSTKLDTGLYIKDGLVNGNPFPMIRFILSQPVNPQQFLQTVWTSTVLMQAEKCADNELQGFFAEDENGISTVLDDRELQNIVSVLKDENLYLGKAFSFEEMRDGMSMSTEWWEIED